MNSRSLLLLMFLSFLTCACSDSPPVATGEDGDRLHAGVGIAKEIEKAHSVSCQVAGKALEKVTTIEVNVSDLQGEPQSILPAIAHLSSVKSFDGALYVSFYTVDEAGGVSSDEGAPRVWLGRFDAKTGKPVPDEK